MAKQWETALISGGGSGIGLRLAEEFLGMGARVALVDLAFNEDARARLSKATGGSPTRAAGPSKRTCAMPSGC